MSQSSEKLTHSWESRRSHIYVAQLYGYTDQEIAKTALMSHLCLTFRLCTVGNKWKTECVKQRAEHQTVQSVLQQTLEDLLIEDI